MGLWWSEVQILSPRLYHRRGVHRLKTLLALFYAITTPALLFTQPGPALRKKPRSRRVDTCGTVFGRHASHGVRITQTYVQSTARTSALSSFIRWVGTWHPQGVPLRFIRQMNADRALARRLCYVNPIAARARCCTIGTTSS